jgi:hypothetical protein
MSIVDALALSGFARKTVESASDFAQVIYNLIMDVRDSYRPGVQCMRGPGPKWRAKHRSWLGDDLRPVPPAGRWILVVAHAAGPTP